MLTWTFSPASARDRSIRLSIMILIMVGVALTALGFKNINLNVPGLPDLDRGGNGPLGLKLGLDLRGGGDLVYQADTGTRFELAFLDPISGPDIGTRFAVTFLDPIDAQEVEDALAELSFGEEDLVLENLTVSGLSSTVFLLDTDLLADDDPRRTEFEDTVTAKLGGIVSFESTTIQALTDGKQELEDALEGLRFGEEELVLESFTVEPRGPVNFRIKTSLVLDESDPRRADFQESVEALLGPIDSVRVNEVRPPSTDQMEGVLDTILRRVNLFGTEEPIIQRFGDDRIRVQLPGASGSVSQLLFSEPVQGTDARAIIAGVFVDQGVVDVRVERLGPQVFNVKSSTVSAAARREVERILGDRLSTIAVFNVVSGIDEAKALIGETAQLEFKDRTCNGGVDQLSGACLDPSDADLGLTGDDLARAFVSTDPQTGEWAVSIQFDGRGSDIFGDLTRRIFGDVERRISIFLDDELLLAPVAQAWIRDGRSQITGNFNRERARTLSIQLESGRLPVPLVLIQENDVDALLGSESLRNSLIAGLVGLGLVMAFMITYYRMAGIVAAVALIFYAIMVMAVFKLIPVTLTLAHIGGFILSIGLAVDANILIFERMKEEMRIGRTLASSMEVGFNRAWPAIRDGNVSTLLTCGVLLWFGDRLGGGLVTGFAISLGIGVLASMFTAVVVTRNVLQLLAWIGLGHRIALFTPEGVTSSAQPIGRDT